jgi:hypothetical protein
MPKLNAQMPGGVNGMNEVDDIESKISELKARWPAHSVPPNMWQELEDLEDQLEKAKSAARNGGG